MDDVRIADDRGVGLDLVLDERRLLGRGGGVGRAGVGGDIELNGGLVLLPGVIAVTPTATYWKPTTTKSAMSFQRSSSDAQ